MTRKKRTFAVIAAGVGWVAAVGITVATPHIDALRDHPSLFTRLFLLCATVAAVLTLGLWFERSLLPVVEQIFKLGMRAGRRLDRLDRASGAVQRPLSDDSGWWSMPVGGHGQQDTPPAGWLRR